MGVRRMDHVGVVVGDLEAAIAFFEAVGLSAGGRASVGGDWVDRVIGLRGARSDIVMMSTPDGQGQLELTRFHSPVDDAAEAPAPANRAGLRHVAFLVDDLDQAVANVQTLGHRLIGEVQQYEDVYRLCYVRGPEGVIVELAEELGR